MDVSTARFKQMSAVTAAAVAVAFVAVGYGLWQAGVSHAAVDQATKGARNVVVTTRDVAAGEPFGADAVRLVEVPQAFRQEEALGADALDGVGGVAGARALVSIPANTQLSPQMIAGSAADGRLAAQLAAGMEAVSLSVNDETGVAGQVQPFDEVRVVCVTEAAGGVVDLDELCPSARVMSVGGDGAGEGAAYSAITLELTPEQADAVRRAQASGTISVQLVAGGVLSGGMVEHDG
ncbi:Flp pilus assembly protein CpaB [uncultured Senegalimassilia sp.]|uniref:Flp pilus assembly protein CpaB n=1 Tax=uncultured Senegalimassilia sp. TaxID=1714350 RepID=UPI0025CEC7ED|nr:Flp pilus assembly protein CpaB [uncultured Senegalimassilia sp.]